MKVSPRTVRLTVLSQCLAVAVGIEIEIGKEREIELKASAGV